MSINTSLFPASVWDTSSPDRIADRSINRGPDFEDWDQMVAEMLAVQTEILRNYRRLLTNDNAATAPICTPVYMKSNGNVDFGRANAAGTTFLIGLVQADILTTGSGYIQLSGIFVATTAQWDATFGTTGGLAKGAPYYLSGATAGKGTGTAPSTSTQFVKEIGIALSATELQLSSSRPIVIP